MGDREGTQENLGWVKNLWILAPICTLPWRCCCHGDRVGPHFPTVHDFSPSARQTSFQPHNWEMPGSVEGAQRTQKSVRAQFQRLQRGNHTWGSLPHTGFQFSFLSLTHGLMMWPRLIALIILLPLPQECLEVGPMPSLPALSQCLWTSSGVLDSTLHSWTHGPSQPPSNSRVRPSLGVQRSHATDVEHPRRQWKATPRS